MTHSWTLFIFLALFSLPAVAQHKEMKVKYGKISDEEIAMTAYKEDPSAPAVILFDKENISHRFIENVGFVIEIEHHMRAKIFQKSAYWLGDVVIPLYTWQKVPELKASSYNMEGGKLVETKLEKDNVFDEKLTRTRMVKKLTIPAVREGSIIEFRYKIVDEGIIGLPDWTFQMADVPTIWSEFEASVPSFIEFSKSSKGWVPFSLSEENQRTERMSVNITNRTEGKVATTTTKNFQVEYLTNTMHFIQENVPALKPEPFIGSTTDYLSQINFDVQAVYEVQLVPSGMTYRISNAMPKVRSGSWMNLGEELLDDVYDNIIRSSKYTADATASCIAGKTTNSEKTAAIYAFIGKNYQLLDRDYIFMSQTMESLAKTHKGSPTDLNLLLINMLHQAKINAYPLLISTRKNGHILPFRVRTNDVNRVIVAVEAEANTQVLIDLAGWPNPVGLLPEDDLNDEGLLLKNKESISWIPLQNKMALRRAVMADFTLQPETGMTGLVSFSESGYGAVDARTKIKEKNAQTFVQEQFKDLIADGSATELKIENAENWQEAAIQGTFNIVTSAFVSFSGDKMYLTPALGFGLTENPFKNPDRKFNIDLGTPKSQSYNFTFKIPTGYKVEETPKPMKLTFGENALLFEYFTEATPEQIKISIRQSTKKPYIDVDQYLGLRQFFSTVIAKLGEQFVLTKG